jgi:hypothetical protein
MILRFLFRASLVAAAATAALLPLPAGIVERWYSLGLYPRVQAVVTPYSNQVPIALLDVAAAALLFWVVWRFVRAIRASGAVRALVSSAVGLLTIAAAVYLAFLLLWGLNYRRIPIEEKVDLDESRITRETARQLAREAVVRVNALHAPAHRRPAGGPALEQAFAAAERRLGHGSSMVPAVPKRSLLEWYFRWAAIDGMTDPLFLEIIINPDVLPIERPFVIAHEWGHLAGYANEDEANLMAWLTCLEGGPLAQYSGWLVIYGHVMNALPREDRRLIAAELTEGPREDLRAVANRFALSKPLVRNVARETYDAYLRANRVEEGIASYDAVIRLILAAGPDHGWAPRPRPR